MSILKREDPQTIVNILNGNQTILVMKQAPKNGEGRWWYLYCSKGKPYLLNKLTRDICFWEEKQITADDMLNGKVVARFWCDKVEEIKQTDYGYYFTDTCVAPSELQRLSCLTNQQIYEYAFLGRMSHKAYTIHISKLEIFDRPKELVDFEKPMSNKCLDCEFRGFPFRYCENCMWGWMLSKAPTNYCYIREQ